MRNLLLFAMTLLLTQELVAQTFVNTGDLAIPDNNTYVNQPISVSGLGNLNCSTPLGVQSVCFGIAHPYTGDLDIFLVSPAGTVVELSTDNGGSGDHYGNGTLNDAGALTCLNMTAGTAITAGAAPFASSFRPEGNLVDFQNGQNPNGTWNLRIRDDSGGDVGTLFYWSITFAAVTTGCPPTNDLCANATSLPCGTAALAGTTVNTTNIAHGTGCTMSNLGVWYTFVGDGQTTTISTTGTGGFDQEMSIVSGTCGSLTNIVCIDANGGNGTESHTFTSTVGVTYYVYVADFSSIGSTTGTFTISRTCTPPPTPPVNDLCANATNLPCGTTNLAGTTVGSTNIAHATSCGISNFGVWYSFVGDGQVTTISTTGTGGFNQEMAVLMGTCGSFTSIGCVDANGNNGTESRTFSAVSGSTYYIYVAHPTSGSNTTGTFTISRSCSAPTNADCLGATQICNDITLPGNSGDFGTIQEITNYTTAGCRLDCDVWCALGLASPTPSLEHQTSWFYFNAANNGTVSFDIETTVDYDFAIYNGNCTFLGAPVRCSFSELAGNTGLGNGATDDSEWVDGDKWVAPLNVVAGQFYIVMIDNFTSDNTPFNINFSFSSPDVLNCNPVPLPVNLNQFHGSYIEGYNEITWTSINEINNNYYVVERSNDLENWAFVAKVDGSGNSTIDNSYTCRDEFFTHNSANYYRLTQIDFDGTTTILEDNIILINNYSKREIVAVYNMLGQEIPKDTPGFKLVLYSDGSTEKIMGTIKD